MTAAKVSARTPLGPKHKQREVLDLKAPSSGHNPFPFSFTIPSQVEMRLCSWTITAMVTNLAILGPLSLWFCFYCTNFYVFYWNWRTKKTIQEERVEENPSDDEEAGTSIATQNKKKTDNRENEEESTEVEAIVRFEESNINNEEEERPWLDSLIREELEPTPVKSLKSKESESGIQTQRC